MNCNLVTALFLLFVLVACENRTEKKHLFFLHNRFLEEHQLDDAHTEYGRVEYHEILDAFANAGFHVHSEQRNGNVNARDYATIIARQIDSLIDAGALPQEITVVGTSKGGYIAQYVSTILHNANLNFVFVASFRQSDMEQIPEVNFCGNILTIYERSDPFGVSAEERYRASSCNIQRFKEIQLNTGLRHGFLFKRLDKWIQPTIDWANGVSSE